MRNTDIYPIRRSARLPRRPLHYALVALTVMAGMYFVTVSRAASAPLGLEPEDGTICGSLVVSDQAASGAKAVKFAAATPSGGRTVNVSTGPELAAALADAQPGDTIQMADGTYNGTTVQLGNYYVAFGIGRSGTPAAPITLTGSRNTVINPGGPETRYGLYIYQASYWNITGITVTGATKGIVTDESNHIVIDGVRVANTGSEGVHFRAFSSDNAIRNSVIELTGLIQPQYGEGVYIGSANSNWATYSGGQPDASNRNKVLCNTIGNTAAENIDVKEGTQDGVIAGNNFDGVNMQGINFADSWIDVKGNGYTISNNRGVVSSATSTVFANGFELHQAVAGWGINNVFHNNIMNLTNATGAGFYQQRNLTGNILSCDNTVLNAPQGFGIYNVSPRACNDQ